MQTLESTRFFDEVVRATPGGARLRTCLQCGTCGGSCPNGADMDHTPRALFALVLAGQRDEVLRSNAMWACVNCYACMARCPRRIPITDVMATLRRMAVREGLAADADAVALARNFVHFVEQYGRSFELGIASRFYLTRRPGALLGMGPLGFKLFRHGRLHLRPARIREREELRRVLERARQLGGAE